MNNNPNYIECSKSGGNATKEKWNAIKEEYFTNPSKCKVCKSPLEYIKRSNQFCSNSCRIVFTNSNRCISNHHRNKVSNSIKRIRVEFYFKSPKQCSVCSCILPYSLRKRKSCSSKCRSVLNSIGGKVGGRKSAEVQAESRRSKNEILFSEKCKEYFNKVLTNEPMFNGWDADVIIEDIKVAILWNGKWHYEKLTENHSVIQVQNRDKIKIDEIKKCGYIPYVIKDMGKFNPNKVEEEFNSFIKWARSSIVRAADS